MIAAAFVVFLAVVASRADSEPDLTIVTSEAGSDGALATSAQSDFSRRIGKQFPVAENSVNTRGSGGGRQKATNLVSGKRGNEKTRGSGEGSRRWEEELFVLGNCLGLRERTILWWLRLRLESSARGSLARRHLGDAGALHMRTERWRVGAGTTPEISILSW